MSTVVLSEQEIKDVILPVINEQEKKYWIPSITYAFYDSITGTTVTILPIHQIDESEKSTITFQKLGITVEGELADFQKKLQDAFIQKMCEVSSEYKKFYENSIQKIDEKTSIFRETLVQRFLKDGYVKNDIHMLLSGSGVKALPKILYQYAHGEFLAPIENHFDLPDREVAAGEIYFANLNPALPSEFAGVRPVLILKTHLPIVTVVPLSSTVYDKEDNLRVMLSHNNYHIEKDSYVCLEFPKSIDKSRLLRKIDQLDEVDFKEIQKRILEDTFEPSFLEEYHDEKIKQLFEELEIEKQDALDKTKNKIALSKDELNFVESQYAEQRQGIKKDINLQSEVSDSVNVNCELHSKVTVALDKENFETQIVTNPILTVELPDNVLSSTSEDISIKHKTSQQRIWMNESLMKFDLTDVELIEICEQKFMEMRGKGSKLKFHGPKVERVTKEDGTIGSLMDGITVYYNKNHSEPKSSIFETEIKFMSTQVAFYCGDKRYKNDPDLEKLLVEKLTQKYPQVYEKYYLKKVTDGLHYGYLKNGNAYGRADVLDLKTSWIGKKFVNPLSIIQYGLPEENDIAEMIQDLT